MRSGLAVSEGVPLEHDASQAVGALARGVTPDEAGTARCAERRAQRWIFRQAYALATLLVDAAVHINLCARPRAVSTAGPFARKMRHGHARVVRAAIPRRQVALDPLRVS